MKVAALHGSSITPGLAVEVEETKLTNVPTSEDTFFGLTPSTRGHQHDGPLGQKLLSAESPRLSHVK